jgi:hypothetical protein
MATAGAASKGKTMPKAKKQDGLDQLADFFAVVPWWLPFLLAVAVWFVATSLGPLVAGGPQ